MSSTSLARKWVISSIRALRDSVRSAPGERSFPTPQTDHKLGPFDHRAVGESCVHTVAAVAKGWVGAPVARKEDPALLTGRARFIDDLSPVPGLKHVAIVRSPHPHARICGIDVARARALRGVIAVVTGGGVGRPDPERGESAARLLSLRNRPG